MSFAIQAPLIPDSANTPLDARTVVNSKTDILSINLPYEGMLVYCRADKKIYKVTGLKSLKLGPITADNCAVDTYEEFTAGTGNSGTVSQVQADWNQTDTEADDYIKNKPEIPEAGLLLDRLKTVTNVVSLDNASVNAYLNEVDGASEVTFEFNIPTGPKGDQGTPGKDGKDGENGAPGTPGADGYTPKRGTDYWTSSDISEIHEYIDAKVQEASTAIINNHMDNLADNGAW